MKKTDDLPEEIRKIVNESAERIWNDKFDSNSQIAAIGMTLGVIAGIESVMKNVKKKGPISFGDMTKGMAGGDIKNMVDVFKGDPLNIIGSLDSKQIQKLTGAIRNHMMDTICNGNEKLLSMASDIDEFIEKKLDIPAMMLGSLEGNIQKKMKSSKSSDFGDKLSKYWGTQD